MPFSRYMAICLYDPEDGYYSRHVERFGKAGDFYTSSDVHAVYGRLLARQFQEMWKTLDQPSEIDIVELGPGRGLFAQDVLDWSEKKFPEFFRAVRYVLVERSGALRERLQQRFAGRGTAKVQICETVDDRSSPLRNTIVFANEFFDALPVEVISSEGRMYVDMQKEKFVETFLPATPDIYEYLDRHSVRPAAGERVEAAFESLRVMNGLAASVRRGFLVLVDYGYARVEQLEGRHLDTLMTYRQHSASPDPFAAPGEQDITAHVNFTALAAAAQANGMQIQPLLTQSQFLMGIGEATQFGDAFEGCIQLQEQAKVALQLKHLVTPAGMGEIFHVLLASKGVDNLKLEALSGLSFTRSRIAG